MIRVADFQLSSLQSWLENQPAVFSFFDDPARSSLLLSYVLSREVGGPHHNLAKSLRSTYEGDTRLIPPSELRPEILEADGRFGIRIRREDGRALAFRRPSLARFSDPATGEAAIFPERVAEFLREQSITPVIVKEWIHNLVFADFDPRASTYLNPLWYLNNNYALLFSALVAERKMVFHSIHDVLEHAREAREDGWATAALVASNTHRFLSEYFGKAGRGNLPSQVIPYLAGKFLDELTQWPFYHSRPRMLLIDELLRALERSGIRAQDQRFLYSFPVHAVAEITRLSLGAKLERAEAHMAVEALLVELHACSGAEAARARPPQELVFEAPA